MYKKLIFSTLLFNALYISNAIFGMDLYETDLGNNQGVVTIAVLNNNRTKDTQVDWHLKTGNVSHSTELPNMYTPCVMKKAQNSTDNNTLQIISEKNSLNLDLSNFSEGLKNVINGIKENQQLIIKHKVYNNNVKTIPYITTYLQQGKIEIIWYYQTSIQFLIGIGLIGAAIYLLSFFLKKNLIS